MLRSLSDKFCKDSTHPRHNNTFQVHLDIQQSTNKPKVLIRDDQKDSSSNRTALFSGSDRGSCYTESSHNHENQKKFHPIPKKKVLGA
jgi:hypothetical protein